MSDVDEDGDEVAIADGMEPESATGDVGDDEGGGEDPEDFVAVGGPVTRVLSPSKTLRPISEKTRQLLKEAAVKMKKELDEDEQPLDYDGLPQEPATPTGNAVSPPAEPAGVVPDLGQADPHAPPQAVAPDAETAKRLEDIEARAAELDAREKQLVEAERTGDLTKLRDVYYEKGAPAVVEIIKKWAQTSTDDELKDEIADLVSDLSHQFLGVEIPQEVKDRLENRRTRKGIKVWKADQERAAKDAEERQKATQAEQNRVRVKGILQQEITKPEHVKAFPWLTAEPNAGEIVFDVIDAQHAKDGTRLTIEEAAKRANDYLKSQSQAWFDKRRHLFTTASSQGAQANGQQQRSQGDPQGSRSQAQQPKPKPTPPPAPPMKNGKWDPDAHRRQVKSKFRTAFTRQDDE